MLSPDPLPRMNQQQSYQRDPHLSDQNYKGSLNKPPPAQPPLLLEGDNYMVNQDGIARTLYQLESAYPLETCEIPISIEEEYDIDKSRKKFLIRRTMNSHLSPLLDTESSDSRMVQLGDIVHSLDFQEIDHGILDGVGTGATTWESSLAMSLFFSTNPEVLRGHVVELGSGVGLGGILNLISSSASPSPLLASMTLTDNPQQVLNQCLQNVENCYDGSIPIHVAKLDWYDTLRGMRRGDVSHIEYDTVVVCDCAYRSEDIVALATTMESLLRRSNPLAKIHLFGPQNRKVFLDLIADLKEGHSLNVNVEHIHLHRFRLKPAFRLSRSQSVSSEYSATYLHVECNRRRQVSCNIKEEAIMSDID